MIKISGSRLLSFYLISCRPTTIKLKYFQFLTFLYIFYLFIFLGNFDFRILIVLVWKKIDFRSDMFRLQYLFIYYWIILTWDSKNIDINLIILYPKTREAVCYIIQLKTYSHCTRGWIILYINIFVVLLPHKSSFIYILTFNQSLMWN